ncbi:MAG: MarR family transcriptional regulator [Parvibaculum sp.]|nr:MarR family transcriptional regulator [Parvibaculum sp.]
MTGKNSAAEAESPEPVATDPFAPEHFLRAITEVGTMLATIYDRRTGLTRNQTRIVFELLERDGQTQTELANALAIHKVSAGIYVGELEELGLVERRTHPTDGRAKCICLTPLLHANKHIGQHHYERLHAAAIDGIAREDYLAMLKSLERMRDNLLELDAAEKKQASSL